MDGWLIFEVALEVALTCFGFSATATFVEFTFERLVALATV
jgi:hypothetical protein